MNIVPRKWLMFVCEVEDEEQLLDALMKNQKPYKKGPGLSPGKFELMTIKQLRDVPLKPKTIPTFTIYIRKSYKGSNKYFDTSSLQLLLESDKPVMYQVASNFNCHENGSVHTNLFSGYYLTDHMTDRTQGPSASAGAGLGAIIRLKHQMESPINLLEDIKQISVMNGKITRVDNDNVDSIDIDLIKIGLHTDVSANFDRSSSCIFYEDGKIIDQVYVSTIRLDERKTIRPYVRQTVKILLKAAYDGTFLCANERGTERLVLTLVGGGVFHNPIEEIYQSIVNAFVNIGCHSNLKEVILPMYDVRNNPNPLINKLKDAGVPEECIKLEYKE